MQVEDTDIPAVKIVTPKKFGDDRGFFSEVYNRSMWVNLGLNLEFVQDNHSFSAAVGILRGLHFQTPPHAQDKLVRVARGRILDVAVDIRRSAPTFGRYVAVELSAENCRQLLVPIGFAHGFVTLEPDTEVLYKTTANYSPAHDRGVAWDDPESVWRGRCRWVARCCRIRTSAGPGLRTRGICSGDAHRSHGIQGAGRDVAIERSDRDTEIIPLSRPAFALEDRQTVLAGIEAVRPDVVISAAAFTAVDRAEAEEDLAIRVNGEGAGMSPKRPPNRRSAAASLHGLRVRRRPRSSLSRG